MTGPAEFGSAASKPWIGERLQANRSDVVTFDGQGYAICLDAAADSLTWSVPEAIARARGTGTSFSSDLERIALTDAVEAWLFPKLQHQPVHQVVLLLDRTMGTAISVELVLRAVNARLRPGVRILRGTLVGYPYAYGGSAFPRFRPEARRVSFTAGNDTSYIDFDRTGQPAGAGRAPAHWRVSGFALDIAPSVWGVVWRSRTAVSFTLLDEARGVASGQVVQSDPLGVRTFGLVADIRRSMD